MNLSKSRYCTYITCPKKLWLQLNKPEEEVISDAQKHLMQQGTEAGKVARGYFGSFALAEIISGGRPDIPAMVSRTRELMASGAQTICEAAFDYGGNYCAVDILHREKDGWAVYEVKSASEYDKIYCNDVAYQLWVLKNCGLNVTGAKLLQPDINYIKHGDIGLKQLFKAKDLYAEAQSKSAVVERDVNGARVYLSQTAEPPTVFCGGCSGCGFFGHCRGSIAQQSVFNLRGIKPKYSYVNGGIVTFSDFAARCDFGRKTFKDYRGKQVTLSDGLKIQLGYDSPAKGTYVDRDRIRAFLAKLSYPLCFLDFESFQYALPQIDGTRPWQQIPSQYSLHTVESGRDAEEIVAGLGNSGHPLLKHTGFLGETDDPRRALAEKLCMDIPEDACVVVYNKTFECGILGQLAADFPDLGGRLLGISAHIVDLMEPFRDFYYYNSAMEGRYSIKYVLPAIYPKNTALSYNGLAVKNGSQAMMLYPQLKTMPPAVRSRARRDLLEYCKLDTFAEVKLWQELVRVS